MQIPDPVRRQLFQLAREIILTSSRGIQGAAVIPPSLSVPAAGCFVSLHRRDTHALRGCIGNFDPSKPIVSLLTTAAEGALRDPRFTDAPITIAELPHLTLEITLLDPLQRAPSPLTFEPKLHGIYLTIQGRTGCFLPQVGQSTGWTREQLLTRLCEEKLSMPSTAWQDPSAVLHTFTAQIIGPAPLI